MANIMTNEERVLKSYRPVPPAPALPWHGKELKRFWAIARQVGVDKEGVHALITGHYPGKSTLHELTRVEFIKLMDILFHGPGGAAQTISDLEEQHGNIGDGQWRKIRHLQRTLRWSDQHLVNYICKLGHISHIRFLTADVARSAIIGMGKMHATNL